MRRNRFCSHRDANFDCIAFFFVGNVLELRNLLRILPSEVMNCKSPLRPKDAVCGSPAVADRDCLTGFDICNILPQLQNIMKTRSIVAFVGVSLVAILVAIIFSSGRIKGLLSDDNVVLGACAITKNGQSKFVCAGETGTCIKKYLGYTLTCSGRSVEEEEDKPMQSKDQL